MTDYVKSLNINSVSHPVLGKAIENCNSSEGAIKDLKVWQGTLEEFQNQPCDLYAWSKSGVDLSVFENVAEEIDTMMCRPLVEFNGYAFTGMWRVDKNFTFTPIFNETMYFCKNDSYIFAFRPSYTGHMYRSADGINWTDIGATDKAVSGVVYYNNNFYAATQQGSCVSADGLTWTALDSTPVDTVCLCHGYVFTSNEEQAFKLSTNDATELDVPLRYVDCYYNDELIAHDEGNGIYVADADDPLTWTKIEQHALYFEDYEYGQPGITVSNGVAYAFDNSEATILSSTDFINWDVFKEVQIAEMWRKVRSSNIFGAALTCFGGMMDISAIQLKTEVDAYTSTEEPAVNDLVFNGSYVLNDKVSAVGTNTITVGSDTYTRASAKDTTSNAPMSFKDPTMLCNVVDTMLVQGDDLVMKRPLTEDEETSLDRRGSLYGVSAKTGAVFSTPTVSKRLYRGLGPLESTRYSYQYGGGLVGSSNSGYNLLVAGQTHVYSLRKDGSWGTETDAPNYSWNAISDGGSYAMVISPTTHAARYDGANWTNLTLPSAQWGLIAYGNGRFVIVEKTLNTTTNKAAYSTNYGHAWTSVTLPVSKTWNTLIYANGKFILAGANTILYSADGATWTQATTSPSTLWNPYTVAYGSQGFVMLDDQFIYRSTDGITWSTANLPNILHLNWDSSMRIAYGEGFYVVVIENYNSTYNPVGSRIVYSKDGTNWNILVDGLKSRPRDIIYNARLEAFIIPDIDGNEVFMLPVTSTSLSPDAIGYKNGVVTQTLKNVGGFIRWVTDAT